MLTATRPGPTGQVTPSQAPASDARLPAVVWALCAVVVAAGVALRVRAAGEMWLDEAQSVAIARLRLSDLFAALHQDGSPPLYYLLLHFWIMIAGTGAWGTRLLSSVLGLISLGLFYYVARRWAGPAGGVIVLVVAVTNPWFTRYATETRMYALVVMLVLVLLIVLDRMVTGPGVLNAAWLALVSGALLLTHYWSQFLLAALGIVAVAALFTHRRGAAAYTLAGLAGGVVLFLPWLPSFLFQRQHTGTPWHTAVRPTDLIGVVQAWSAPDLTLTWAKRLAIPVVLLAAWAAARGRLAAMLAGWVVATLGLAYAVSARSGAAVVSRYTAVVVPLVLILVGLGLNALARYIRAPAVAALAVGWLACSQIVMTTPRTQADEIASVINAKGTPADTVAYCPDQLGPSTSRLVTSVHRQVSYPDGAAAGRVDWVDYLAKQRAGSPTRFATMLLQVTPPGARIWVVGSRGYVGASRCTTLAKVLNAKLGRGRQDMRPDTQRKEHATLTSWQVPVTSTNPR